jgi:hypothetical protein
MTLKKSLREREIELQTLLASPAGREELRILASRYSTGNGRVKPEGASVVTYILVHEREHGLIAG